MVKSHTASPKEGAKSVSNRIEGSSRKFLPRTKLPESMAHESTPVRTRSGSCSALLAGCDTEQKPAATATLLNNSEIQSALKNLADAIDTLVGDVGEFDSNSWKEVVPQVTSSSEEVSSAFEALRHALNVPNS
jgi:hypothetical protein